MEHNFLMTEWSQGKDSVWKEVVEKYGGNPEAFNWGTWDFFDWAVGKAWFTIGSVSKARKFGWTRYDDSYDAWIETFRSFENAGVLPFQDTQNVRKTEKLSQLLPHPADLVAAREAPIENGINGVNGFKANGTNGTNGFEAHATNHVAPSVEIDQEA
jgi:hypothetical protein